MCAPNLRVAWGQGCKLLLKDLLLARALLEIERGLNVCRALGSIPSTKKENNLVSLACCGVAFTFFFLTYYCGVWEVGVC